jgi:spermidine synthase
LHLEQNQNRTDSLVLYLSMFVMGGCGLAYQYTLSKLASDILGNSVQQWAIVIGVMMFFMGVGSDLQKHLSGRKLIDNFIVAEIALAICGAFSPIAMLYTYGAAPHYFALVQYGFIAAIGVLIGFEIPLLARINENFVGELRFNLGGILRMDYIGSLAGALLWVFALPAFFSITEIPFVLGALSLAAAMLALLYFRKRLLHPRIVFASWSIAVASVGIGFLEVGHWTAYAEQQLYKERIVFSETSPYQRIVVTKSKTNDLSLYINGNLQFHSHDEHIYHENLVHPAMTVAPNIERVLILGGGDGLAAREVLKYPGVKEIILVDLDPMVTDLATHNPFFVQVNEGSLKNARTKVIRNHALVDAGEQVVMVRNQNIRRSKEYTPQGKVNILNVDALNFLEQVSGKFDVAILDFPDPNSPELSKLYSKRFYSLLSQRLTPQGLIAQQATSPFFAKEAFLVVGRTMEAAGFSALPYHDIVPSFGEWGWWIAAPNSLYEKEGLRDAIKGTHEFSVYTQYLTPERMRANLEFGKDRLLTPNQDFTTLTSNRVYEYYLQGWKRNFY